MDALPPVKGPMKPILTFCFATAPVKKPVVPMNMTMNMAIAKIFMDFDMRNLLSS
jgi:hypothetical protein